MTRHCTTIPGAVASQDPLVCTTGHTPVTAPAVARHAHKPGASEQSPRNGRPNREDEPTTERIPETRRMRGKLRDEAPKITEHLSANSGLAGWATHAWASPAARGRRSRVNSQCANAVKEIDSTVCAAPRRAASALYSRCSRGELRAGVDGPGTRVPAAARDPGRGCAGSRGGCLTRARAQATRPSLG